MARRSVIWLLLMFSGLLAGGCGYSSQAAFREGIQSVHVQIFDSREFRRDLEFLLTEAVMKRINAETPYRVVDKGKADSILTGEVLEVRQSAFAPDFVSRQPRDTQMTMVVRVQWKDLRSGKILVDRPLLLQSVNYLPAADESQAFAQQKVVDRMAERIVSQLYGPW